MNETIETAGEQITLLDVCRMGGPITGAVSGLTFVIILALLIIGIIKKIKGRDNNISWWIMRISLALFFFGLAGFFNDIFNFNLKISSFEVGRAFAFFFETVCLSSFKICITSSIAFLGLISCLIIGPEKKTNKNANKVNSADG